jgi:energy-coupling factor transporter ATP-binding protein EcfA2
VSKVLLVAGPKGSGKSTLIKALFPELPVRFTEPPIYRVYEASQGVKVVEVPGRADVVRLLLAAPPWKVSVGLLLADGSQQPRADPELLPLVLAAPQKALVLTKLDLASPEAIERARAEAQKVDLDFFTVSATTGQGVPELLQWIMTGARPKPPETPQPKVEERRAPVLLVDVVPVPSPRPPRAALSPEEEVVLKACDGRKSIAEIAMELGTSPAAVKGVVDKLFSKGFIKELKPKVVV